MQPASDSFFVDSRKIPSRVSIPLSSGKRRSSGIMTAFDDAVLREDSFLVILLTRIRSDEGTPLPPGRTMPPSKSQSGQTRRQQPWQDHASKPKPKRSRPGPFFIPRSSSPVLFFVDPSFFLDLRSPFRSFEDLRRFLHLPSLRNASILPFSFGWRGGRRKSSIF